MCLGEGKGSGPYRCCLFLHSGSFDRVYHAMAITNVALARGGEVHILFSYRALQRLGQGRLHGLVPRGGPNALHLTGHTCYIRGSAIESMLQAWGTAARSIASISMPHPEGFAR